MAKVLVVDDEADIRRLIELNLRLDGHEVVTAVDGVDAVEAARRERPDAIVLDVMMPRLDGFEVLRELKHDAAEGTSGVPVVLLTARTERIDRIRGGIEGAVVYLTKPFSVADLRRSVQEVLVADEAAARKAALHGALGELARLEGGGSVAESSPRPRLTRFEPQGPRPTTPAGPVLDRSVLSARQSEVLDVAAAAPTVVAAARELGVSRSYLYATLDRAAVLLGMASGPELVRAVRAAGPPG